MRKNHSITFIFISFILLLTDSSWAQSQTEFNKPFNYARYLDEVFELSLSELISLPEDVVIVSGHYWVSAGAVHSTLLRSEDGGKTWEEKNLIFESCGIEHLKTFGLSHIWGLAIYKTEGVNWPQYLIRSVDAGATWTALPLNFINQENPLDHATEFKFYDENKGLLTMNGSIGNLRTYYTVDGGDTWKMLWSTNTDRNHIEMYSFPSNTNFLEKALWKKQLGSFLIEVKVRIREENQFYVVEAMRFDDRFIGQNNKEKWIIQSMIPKYYKVQGDELVAVDGKG